MSRKFLWIAGALLLAGSALYVSMLAAAATPQFERTPDPMQQEMHNRMMREANKKRQQDIRTDTDKLFQLATDLKAAVDKSNENTLSLEVIRKADDVEKLAKKVKEKMRDAIGPPAEPAPQDRSPQQLPGIPR